MSEEELVHLRGPFDVDEVRTSPHTRKLAVQDTALATVERIGVPWEQYVQDRAAVIPVGRAGAVEDIAQAVSYFVDERSGFVSGQVLYVAGGPRV